MRALPIIDEIAPTLSEGMEDFVAECISCRAGSADGEVATKQVSMMLACFELHEAAATEGADRDAALKRQFEACLLASVLCADRCPGDEDGCRCARSCRDYALLAANQAGLRAA